MGDVIRSGNGDGVWSEMRERLDRLAAELDDTHHFSAERTRSVLDARAASIGPAPATSIEDAPRIELLTLTLARERFAIETRYVREIVSPTGLTPVPGTPDYIRGVATLRGEILAIFDLRRLFGLAIDDGANTARVVILGTERMELGILAEHVSEVISLPLEGLAERQPATTRIDGASVLGVTADALIVLDGAALLADPRLFVDHQVALDAPLEKRSWRSH